MKKTGILFVLILIALFFVSCSDSEKLELRIADRWREECYCGNNNCECSMPSDLTFLLYRHSYNLVSVIV